MSFLEEHINLLLCNFVVVILFVLDISMGYPIKSLIN